MFNIEDIDLNIPLHMRKCLENWYSLENLSDQYLKIKDLFIELEYKWRKTPLTPQQRNSINLYLCEGYTQKEAGEILGIGTRAVAKSVNEGIDLLIGETDGRITRESA